LESYLWRCLMRSKEREAEKKNASEKGFRR
jgi:hypothetical protein